MDSSICNQSVCYVTDYIMLIGGKERQLLEILRYLRCHGFDFHVISLSSKGLLYKSLHEDYQEQVSLIERQEIGIIKTLRTIRQYIRYHRVTTIYHTFDSLSSGYVIIASCFLPAKIINGSIRHCGVERRFNYLIEVILLQMSGVVIANSKAGLKYYHIRKGCVLYNAIDQQRFTTTSGHYDSIIMVANFSYYKDHSSFFQATSGLVREGKIKKVGLVGDGKFLCKWKQYVRREGLEAYYFFYGHVAQVEQILIEYGIGVLCSTLKYKEGISNSILEYMS
jgi:glycosyltransferase involved in cell wall biosynthesis